MALPVSKPLLSLQDRFSKHFHPAPKLHGRTVVVTGASRGIGLAIAYAFAAQCASRIFLVGRNEQTLLNAAEVVSKGCQTGISVHVKEGDVKDRKFWVEVMNETKDIDILVNAAGMAQSSLLITATPEHLETVVQTNLMGTMWGCRIMSKSMVRQKRTRDNTGCIINVASLLAVKGGKGSTAYAASKAGVLGLTRSLAEELGPSNIRVNAIVPGYIETRMTKDMTPAARETAINRIPQKRFGTIEEVADAAVFLAVNGYANNCVLNLDGGLSAT
ncbi:Short-chain dehydrogenase/reductase, conserved site [Lasallia pustulata]|uniref:Short-chain dehydrogenase/reductase, conserved site n=1 Tax=Lasallia pustulata TaxID=136370 RepID=A0A1W5D022_9LECA|nr:Short-chain dehydrogenase/reductase, conserved site [Lasallia pustulata]